MVGTSSVLKKASPNGKLVLYLRCRDYASITEPIGLFQVIYFFNTVIFHLFCIIFPFVDGVVELDPPYIKYRKVFAQLVAHFRYGREKDEVMGIKFHRDFILASTQIFPTSTNNQKLTDVQVTARDSHNMCIYDRISQVVT